MIMKTRHLYCAVSAAVLLAFPAAVPALPFAAPTVSWSGDTTGAALCTGDVNGDALTDVAIQASNTTLNWFVNTGGGNFTASHVLSVAGARATGAQTADLDRDGDADAVMVIDTNPSDAWNNSELAVFINSGSGFTKTQQFGIPGYLDDALPIAADVDSDGDTDMALQLGAYPGKSQLIICLNNGSGTLAAPVAVDGDTPEYPNGLVAGDFNNDGKTDLVVSHRQTTVSGNADSGVYLYSGLGQGNFGAALKQEVPFLSAGQMEAGDLNRDGRTDLIFRNDWLPAAVRWRANAGGSFSAHTDLYWANQNTDAVGLSTMADIDEDGDLDVVYGRWANSVPDLLWSRNNGAGQFAAAEVLQSGRTTGVGMIKPMDVDLDGDTDLVMVTGTGLEVSLNKAIHRKTEATFTTVNVATVLNGEPRLASADFDRDGEEDLVVLSPDNGTLRWFAANGSGFGAAVTISSAVTGAVAMAVGDVTGDGLPDVVIGIPSLGQIHVMRNVGNGATWQTQVMPNLANVRTLHIADVDVDGALDVVAFSQSASYRTVLFRNTSRNATAWTQETVSTTINAVDEIQSVQFRRPGRPELLLTTFDPEVGLCEVRQLAWNGSSWGATLLAQGNGQSSVSAAADLNGDLTNDFVRSLGYGAGWQPNFNNGSFNPAQTIASIPDGMRCGRLADLNGDGKLDLVAAGYGKVICAANNGAGSFSAPDTLYTAQGAVFRDVVIFDFERDGDLDLAVADAAGDQVRVLLNRRGQYDTVSARQNNGQNFMAGEEKTMIQTSIEHLGTAGDDSLTLRSFRIQLHATNVLAGGGFSLGAPMTAAEAAGLLDKVAIYRDLGTAGTFEVPSDPLVASVTNFSSISNGFLTVPISGAAAQVTAAPGQTMSFLFRVKLRPALSTALKAFNMTVVFEPGGTPVVHNGISPDLLLRDRGATGTYSSTAVIFKPTQLQQWRYDWWSVWDSTGAAANNADPDGDGVPNIIEYVTNTVPTARTGTAAIELVPFNGAAYVQLRLATYLDSKVKVTVETSTNLQTWTALSTRTGDNAWVGTQPILTVNGSVTEAIFPAGSVARIYARLKAEQLP